MITPEDIQLWQESTPAEYGEWDEETIADCDAFLTIVLDMVEKHGTGIES